MLKQRLLSAAVVVPLVILGLLFLPSVCALGLLVVLSTVAILEFYRVLDRASIPAFRFVGAACGILIHLVTYAGFRWHPGADAASSLARADIWENCALAMAVFALLVRQFPQKNNDKPLPTIACTLLGVLYVPFLLNFLLKLGFSAGDVGWTEPLVRRPAFYIVLYPLLVAKLSDAGALFIGMAVGRHKLFPRLSPAKTWEGLAGGILTGIGVSVVFFRLLTPSQLGGLTVPLSHAILLGLLLSLAGMTGDLAESLLKRASLTKDSGNVMPGVGGMLDILDSILFVGPVFYFYVTFMM